MKCRVDDELLQRFFDDEVMQWEHDFVEIGLVHCAECRRRLWELRMIRRVLKEAVEPISVSSQSSAVWSPVKSRLDSHSEFHSHQYARYLLATLRDTLVVVLAAALLFFQADSEPRFSPRKRQHYP